MKRTALSAPAICLLALTGPAFALTLKFPGPADETRTRAEVLTSYLMPVGPYSGGQVPTKVTEGALQQTAWRVQAPGLTTLQLLAPLRDQVAGAGFTIIFECEAVACGGFDFRYGTDVLPEPEMHVDLGDFRYLAAERRTADGPEYLSLIVSRAVDLGFVQVTRVGTNAAPLPEVRMFAGTLGRADRALALTEGVSPPGQVVLSAPTGGLADRLRTGGAQVLADLVFETGSAALSEGEFPALAELAGFLKANPQARVMLVGHTDATGGLEANTALSRERARSVRDRLVTAFEIPPRQVDAEGVGFLSPRAPNDTEAGRLANRRVEVMLLDSGAD